MAQFARLNDREPHKPDPAPDRTAGGAPVVVPVGGAAVEWDAESPARLLHQQLTATFCAPQRVRDDRLPLGTRMAVIAAAVLAPWVAIGAAVLAIA